MTTPALIIFDLETGGTEDERPDTQIAAIALREWEEVEAFERKLVFDEALADPEALEINHYDPVTWARDAVRPVDAVRDFCDFVGRYADLTLLSKRNRPYKAALVGGHNVRTFDIPRMRRLAERHGNPWLAWRWWYPLDTYERAIWADFEAGHFDPRKYQLAEIAKRFGIDASGAHDALEDVRLTARIAQRLVQGEGSK